MSTNLPKYEFKVVPTANSNRTHRLSFGVIAIALISFPSVDVRYFNVVFTHGVRWFALLALCVYLAARQQLFKGLRGGVGFVLVIDCVWILLSTFWSEAPLLSGMKGVAFVAVSVTFISAGYCWAISNPVQGALSILKPLLALAMVAGLLGAVEQVSYLDTGSATLYQGLSFNPNYLGLLIVLGLPTGLWDSYAQRGKRMSLGRAFAVAVVLVLVVMLLASRSRASLGAAAITFFAFFYSSGRKKFAYLIIVTAAMGLLLFEDFQHVVSTYVYKGEGGTLFYTREETWGESLKAAQAGGLVGVGYGASVGEKSFTGGMSAINYGREKGNTVLGVAEELGAIGVGLYVLLIAAIIRTLHGFYVRASDAQVRLALGVIIGTILGLVFESQFEAWWDAPGSAAVCFFWVLVGVGLGVGDKFCSRTRVSLPPTLDHGKLENSSYAERAGTRRAGQARKGILAQAAAPSYP